MNIMGPDSTDANAVNRPSNNRQLSAYIPSYSSDLVISQGYGNKRLRADGDEFAGRSQTVTSEGHRQLLSALKQRYALLKAELEQANRNREKDRKIFHESCLRHVAALQELKIENEQTATKLKDGHDALIAKLIDDERGVIAKVKSDHAKIIATLEVSRFAIFLCPFRVFDNIVIDKSPCVLRLKENHEAAINEYRSMAEAQARQEAEDMRILFQDVLDVADNLNQANSSLEEELGKYKKASTAPSHSPSEFHHDILTENVKLKNDVEQLKLALVDISRGMVHAMLGSL